MSLFKYLLISHFSFNLHFPYSFLDPLFFPHLFSFNPRFISGESWFLIVTRATSLEALIIQHLLKAQIQTQKKIKTISHFLRSSLLQRYDNKTGFLSGRPNRLAWFNTTMCEQNSFRYNLSNISKRVFLCVILLFAKRYS